MCDNERECRAAEAKGFTGAVVHGRLPVTGPSSDLERALLLALADEGPMTADHLASVTGATCSEIAGVMWDLSRRGVVRPGRTTVRRLPQRSWELAETPSA